MIEHDCEQLSPQWFALHKGRPTSSNFSRIMTSKGKRSEQFSSYAAELAGERLATFDTRPEWASHAVRHGRATEGEARRWYEFQFDREVRQAGFITPDSGRYGASPDGLIDPDGGLEIKCPQPKAHAATVTRNAVPSEHVAQVHGNMLVTGRKWWDYLSYCPGLKPVVIRVEWSSLTDELAVLLEVFCDYVDEMTETLRP